MEESFDGVFCDDSFINEYIDDNDDDEFKNEKKIELKEKVKKSNWALVIYSDDELNVMKTNDNIKYWCYGIEYCPDTGRKHYQSFLILNKQKEFSAMKKLFKSAHFEPCYKVALANYRYCKKGVTKKAPKKILGVDFFENIPFDTVSEQGKRNDLIKISERLERGDKIKDIIKDDDKLIFKVSSLIKA